MGFEDTRARPPGRRWMVRLFETSEKLEEHLNRSALRPDQVASISIDADGFFVVVYWVGGGGPPAPERRPARADFGERRPFPRRSFEDDDGPPPDDDDGPRRARPPRPFEREGRWDDRGPRRFDGPPRRPPPRR